MPFARAPRGMWSTGWLRATLGALLCAATAVAHEGDHAVTSAVAQRYQGPALAVRAPETAMVVDGVLRLAATVTGQAGGRLVPFELAVDRVEWVGNVLVLRATLPTTAAEWTATPVDLESLNTILALPFRGDPAFGGIDLRVRRDAARDYLTLDQFSPAPAADRIEALAPPPGEPTREEAAAVWAVAGDATTSIGGATAHGSTQPTGALSGVTVYISAGHGWTAGASAWGLQRPVLLGMCEDYGNIDQLNYMAHYLFNAGATVVPLRPVGWQPVEITLDQDDPDVMYTGAWTDSGNPTYFENGVTNSGVAYRFTTAAASETATARYNLTIPTADYYPVYCFVVASTNRVRQAYRIQHAGGVSTVVVNHREVGNGWVWLGEYFFAAGGGQWVEISNASPEAGVVIADGIRLGGGVGDISRPGPGSVSGYPRDEEAQRYWGETVYGDETVGYSSGIYDVGGLADIDDNIGTGARIAREMNQVPAGGVQVDRWKRVHVEFHTNAFNGDAQGQLTLITTTGSTTNQVQFAEILSNEVDADLLLLDDEFEHPWVDRSAPTLTGAYGAISTSNNSNEFDATLIELAFHDNDEDAELLRDPRVRAAMARATTHGIIRFLNTLPGSQVPLAFAPDRPRAFRIADLGGGAALLAWEPPAADAARGDPATGYVVYESADGLAFGNPTVLGNVLSHTASGLAPGETRFYRVAATNAGGESMPSEVLAIRRPAGGGLASLLVVNGFDRLRRQMNPLQTFTQPPAYAGQSIERQQWRRSNSYDYLIEYAAALAALDEGFVSCANEAISNDAVALADYEIAIWALGVESAEDRTFDANEQARVTAYLNGGGKLFVSGADLAYDLVNQGGGATFATNTLRLGFQSHDAGVYTAIVDDGSLFDGLGVFDFNPTNGAAYDVREPDAFTAGADARAALRYTNAANGIAAIQASTKGYNLVALGFPFEALTSSGLRIDALERILDFLRTASGPLAFDFDSDGDVDFADFGVLRFCLRGPDVDFAPGNLCLQFDRDADNDDDVDLVEFAGFQAAFTGPGGP